MCIRDRQGLSAQDVNGVLNRTVQQGESQNPLFGMVGRVLDQDGDGSFVDDLGSIGMNVLGGLLRR